MINRTTYTDEELVAVRAQRRAGLAEHAAIREAERAERAQRIANYRAMPIYDLALALCNRIINDMTPERSLDMARIIRERMM